MNELMGAAESPALTLDPDLKAIHVFVVNGQAVSAGTAKNLIEELQVKRDRVRALEAKLGVQELVIETTPEHTVE